DAADDGDPGRGHDEPSQEGRAGRDDGAGREICGAGGQRVPAREHRGSVSRGQWLSERGANAKPRAAAIPARQGVPTTRPGSFARTSLEVSRSLTPPRTSPLWH